MDDLLGFLLYLIRKSVSPLFGKRETGTSEEALGARLALVGWIASALAVFLMSAPELAGGNSTLAEVLGNALVFATLGGPFGGLAAAHYAKNDRLAVQIACAVFFGALLGGVPACACNMFTHMAF
jgi:hypothetical protein